MKALALTCLACACHHAVAANLASDFTMSQNPSAGWSHGYRSTITGTSLTLLELSTSINGQTGSMQCWLTNVVPALGVYKNTGTVIFDGGEGTKVPIGETQMHPQANLNALSRYTIPSSGTYRVLSQLARFGGPNDGVAQFDLVIGGSLNWTEVVATPYAYQPLRSTTLTLSAGAFVDFVVSKGDASTAHDSTGIRAAVVNTASIVTSVPTSFDVVEGDLISGSEADLINTDGQAIRFLNNTDTLGGAIELTGTSTVSNPSAIWFHAVTAAGRPGLVAEYSLFDYAASVWRSVSGGLAPTTFANTTSAVIFNPSRFRSVLGELKASIHWTPLNDEDPAQDGWLLEVDSARWELG